ncbi:hypothetical protein [Cetobacterium somerae]|uniref:hypothetical protein n=1 Tax=Cetobacterium somerae TaxID=188913 RepID=UPI00248DC09E|nr:hypothetical protein [Cetobacterium somerae]
MSSVLDRIGKKVIANKELEAQLSEFNFKEFNVSTEDIENIKTNEKILIQNGVKYRDSEYEICVAIYKVSQTLKKYENQSFMEWYKRLGLSKDKVSEFLKRADLYMAYPDHKAFISTLSGRNIKILTHKLIPKEEQQYYIENKVSNISDLKESRITTIKSKGEKVVLNYTNLNKSIKKIRSASPEELNKIQKEVKDLRKYLAELEKEINLKNEQEINKDNLELFDK